MWFLLFVCFVCVSGDLNRGNCRLEPDPSVEYRCIVSGAIEGTRACEASEAPGTIVKPQCRRPNYYTAFPLNNMKCFDGYWDYVARCSPECGRVTPDGKGLVVGGRRVKRGELPWHAAIYSKSYYPYMQICGGSLISNNVVLSAHCFWGDREKQQPASRFAVAVGKLYRPWDDPNDDAQKSDVKVIHLPPRYQGALADFQDDIAVVVVAKAFSFRNYIRPVCLSFDYLFEKQQLYSGNNGKVAGWGLTAANGKPSPVLLTVDLPFVEVGTCIKNSPPQYREYITSDKICAGTLDSGSALCQGDSGGGLAFPELFRGIERYFLRGVVSTAANSENECNTDTYTSFTSINKHETFIKEFWSETGQFKCQDGSFIPAANHCDGTKECVDGSDESEWACVDKRCSSYLFRCNYGACVDKGARCNRVWDCADGSDESTELCLELGTTPISIVPSANDTINSKLGNENFNTPKPEPTLTFQPGSACEDRGVKGTCRKAQSCPSYVLLAKYHDKQQVTECSRDGIEVVVCCTDCQITETSEAAVTPDGILWKTGGTRKIYDKCVEYASTLQYKCKDGKKVTPRKVYDEVKQCHRLDVTVEDDASPVKTRVDFPSLALLGYSNNATVSPRWLCQAFIVSERFLLAAAHCLRTFDELKVSSVAVGVDSLPQSDSPPPASWQIHKIKRTIVNPDHAKASKYNDLMLIETDTEMQFNENVLPLCLSEDPAIPDYVHAHVLGIQGKITNEKVLLQLLSETACSAIIPTNRILKDGINYEHFICYKGFGEAEEICQGSSGRVVTVLGNVPCAGAAVAITSFGLPCSDKGADTPTVYTRLYKHLPWIQSVVWP